MDDKLIAKRKFGNLKQIFLLSIFLNAIFLVSNARAAEIFFDNSNQPAGVGDSLKIDVIINTQEEKINTMAGKVIFPLDALELKEIRDGNSVVNLWLDRPSLKDGQIVFSGITPGGYKGADGLLFSLIFRVLKAGVANLNIVDGQALLNDGKGTSAKLSVSEFILSASENGNGPRINYVIDDKVPPQSFTPEISHNKNIENDKWFAVFVTQDKESGIDHYEGQENKTSKPGQDWQVIASPYVLKDQSLRSYIFIKAVDKAGNTTVAVINPKKSLFTYAKLAVYGIIILIIILGVLRIRRHRRRM